MITSGIFLLLILNFMIETPKTLLFNELYPSIFEKKKMETFEPSAIQIMSIMRRNEEKDKINSFLKNTFTVER